MVGILEHEVGFKAFEDEVAVVWLSMPERCRIAENCCAAERHS